MGIGAIFFSQGNRNALLELMITRPLSLVPMLTLKQANSFEIRHLDGHDRKKDKLDLNPRSNERCSCGGIRAGPAQGDGNRAGLRGITVERAIVPALWLGLAAGIRAAADRAKQPCRFPEHRALVPGSRHCWLESSRSAETDSSMHLSRFICSAPACLPGLPRAC